MRILVWSLTLFSDKMFSKRPANYCRNHTSRSFIEVACYCMLVHWLGLHHSLASHPEGLVAKAVPFGSSFLSSSPSRPDISERSRTGNKPFLTQLVLLRWGSKCFLHGRVHTSTYITSLFSIYSWGTWGSEGVKGCSAVLSWGYIVALQLYTPFPGSLLGGSWWTGGQL